MEKVKNVVTDSKFLLKLDLQTFADDDVIQGGYIPDDSPVVENPLLSNDEPITNEEVPLFEGQEPPVAEEQFEQPPVFDFGGRQVNPNDVDAIKGLHEDWTRSQQYIQQLQQERNQFMQQQQQLFQMQQMQQQQVQPQAPQEEVFDTDKFLERFYEDPNGAIGSITQKAVEQAVSQMRQEYEPIVKERQYQSEIQQLAGKHQDFQQFIPQMTELVQQLGEEESTRIGLENVYYMAKGRVPQQDPMQSLNDPNFVTQHIMNNEQLRNQVYNQLMSNKQQTQPKAPVMGSQYGGQASFSNQNAPRSIEEATRLARQYFNQ